MSINCFQEMMRQKGECLLPLYPLYPTLTHTYHLVIITGIYIYYYYCVHIKFYVCKCTHYVHSSMDKPVDDNTSLASFNQDHGTSSIEPPSATSSHRSEATPSTRSDATPTRQLITQSLQDLYPNRFLFPSNHTSPNTSTDVSNSPTSLQPSSDVPTPPHTPSNPTQSHSPSTRPTCVRGLPSGASNEDVSNLTMQEPIQTSQNHPSSLQPDGSSVLTPLPSDYPFPISGPAHSNPVSLSTRESANSDPFSAASEYTRQQSVDFQKPQANCSSQSSVSSHD